MQQPTLANVRVSSTRDALQIFYAVARRVLPMITRRLDAEERRAIVPGNVYVWEERCANAEVTGLGMERWTDGISWSASRIAQEFLFYRQRDTDPESGQSSAQWANIMKRDPRSGGNSNPRSEVDRLIKQTFSVHVSLPEDRPRGVTRKWHLTAYFSQATLDSLSTIDMIPGVGDVSVPPGWFKNARASKGRAGERPREESPPSWPESWTGVEVPTDPFRPQYAGEGAAVTHDDKHGWTPHGVTHAPVQDYYPAHAEYAAPRHTYGRSHYTPTLHPARLPALADAGIEGYRDPSPFTSQSSSSASSEFGSSPLPTSPNPYGMPLMPALPTPREGAGPSDRNLVPLSVLKTINPPVRDPMAEDCLRRLSNTPRLESSRWSDMRTTVPSR